MTTKVCYSLVFGITIVVFISLDDEEEREEEVLLCRYLTPLTSSNHWTRHPKVPGRQEFNDLGEIGSMVDISAGSRGLSHSKLA